MPGSTPPFSPFSPFPTILLLLLFITTAHAFGAGSIPPSSPVKGTNWLHGDITSVLLSIPKSTSSKANFSDHDVRVIYFGSWLRDLSQVIDAGVLRLVPEAVARAVIGVLGYVEFGSATGEFEVTKERLGAYRHEEHIDNTKGYETEGNAELDSRLRTSVDEKEWEVDHDNGMLNLVASPHAVEFTAAGYIRRTLSKCIKIGREGRRKDDPKMVYESYILLGGVLHVLDDFAAHSNYVELAMHLLGETGVFLYTGDKAVKVGPEGRQIAPVVTGTFGTEDLWHSLLGTVNDKAATQGIEHPQTSLADLEDRLKDARGNIGDTSTSLLDQLSLIPSGIIPSGLRDYIMGITQSSEELKQQEGTAPQEDEAHRKHIDEEVRKLELREEKERPGHHHHRRHPSHHDDEAKHEGDVSEKIGGASDEEHEHMAFGSPNHSTPPSTSSGEESVPLSNLAWSTTDLLDESNTAWDYISNAPSEFLSNVKPILELRDTISSAISSASLPSLSLPTLIPGDFDFDFDIIQRISKAVDSATFSFLSPYMLPVVQKLRETLTVASHDMLDKEGNQFDVFRADSTSLCPSHSLLSKDHFTNVLQHPAGLVATVMTQLAVRAVVEAWEADTTPHDGEEEEGKHEREYTRLFRSFAGVDNASAKHSEEEEELDPAAEKCIDFVISALHHPYYVHTHHSSKNKMQSEMLRVVKKWWAAQPSSRKRELRHVLSKDGVERGLNHRASPEGQLKGHWIVEDNAPVLEGLHGWSWRRWKKGAGREGSVLGDVMDVVQGVRRDPVGSCWRFVSGVVKGEVTAAGLCRDGVETVKGVVEEAVWGQGREKVGGRRDEL